MTNPRTSSRKSDAKLRKRLEDIRRNEPGTIRAAVADEALDYHSDAVTFFSDLQNCGCVCGLVGSLIYYADTHAFFDAHYDEIEELREEYESNTGEANDTFRTTFMGGRILITQGIQALGMQSAQAITDKIKTYNTFTPNMGEYFLLQC